MKIRYFLALAAIQLGCGAADTLDNLTTVTLGAEVLSPIQVDRTVELGATRLPACVNATISDDANQATAQLQNTPNGCVLSVQQANAVLMDADAVKRARDQTSGFDVDSVRSGSVQLQTFQIQTADGTPIDLGQYIASVSLDVNGEALLDHVNPSSLGDDMHKQLTLPSSVVDELKDAVKMNRTATAEVAVSLALTSAAMTSLPSSLHVLFVLQPELQVSLTKAL
jgi:hypothetical protein